ncbi:uncharacterized protein HMPREF1541_06304 [Cyphellophora europaea CBS 101466]|uniref:Major facilitator superfamily (MFS) profile domain-containing protein n=1 Tax=Cyphellophora europaea (strain CBS 101466) TaxID=1220924 RepID=W2RRC6_CYPE1|nr:uncharacterized protein HMPREF1541_06304 [Cyphellophora europaea CBS 101466]ETN38273.1 hypothetical protein HMPREF1541_06304 [Cyphellophora europaea CBS 101466]
MSQTQVEHTELRTMPQRPSQNNTPEVVMRSASDDTTVDGLAPVDRGWPAWKMLLSAFLFESLFWGFPLSFGVFQNYYSHQPEYANQPYVSVIGTVASGISYMGAPIIIPFLKRAHNHRTKMIWGGWALAIIGVLGSSFSKSLGAIIFTQGVMYGVGFTVFYYPIIGMVNEYWVARRGMAYGLLCSASGVSGIIFPFSLEAMLNRYGSATTLRAVAVGLTVTTAPLILFIKGRLPHTTATETHLSSTTDYAFLRRPLFWIYTASNLANGLGYFFPPLYLPSHASSLGLSTRAGAILLALMSIAQVFGQLSFGYLSDRRLPLNALILTSTLVTSAAVLALWGLARSFAVLSVFAVIYGFFGAGYTAMWARMGTAVAGDATAAFAAFGLFNFGKGLGNIFAGPISGGLLMREVDTSRYGAAKYEAIVLFSGSCMLASAVCAAGAWLRPWKTATA